MFFLLFQFILLFAWIDYSPARYGDYSFPWWADGMGWLMTISSAIWIPITAIYKIYNEEGSLWEVSQIVSLSSRVDKMLSLQCLSICV